MPRAARSRTSPILAAPARLERLCAFDTTSGREDAGLPALLDLLEPLGGDVVRQAVTPGRTNVLATWGSPRVLLTTHLDTVPPFVAPRRAGGAIHGRGTVDAKGQVVAQLAAIERVLARGRTDVAWLGVVGEETDAAGARAALALRSKLPDLAVIVDGEPTGCLVASGQQGVLHLRLSCAGRAAHSSTPERGESAAWPLIDWLSRLREVQPAGSAELGRESFNLGLISAGVAANVVPPAACAEVLAHTVPGSTFVEDIRRLAPEGGRVEILLDEPPLRLAVPRGFRSAPVAFGSDLPTLRALAPSAALVLAGPGSIDLAHSDEERITEAELEAGTDLFTSIVDHFLNE